MFMNHEPSINCERQYNEIPLYDVCVLKDLFLIDCNIILALEFMRK